MSFRQALRWLIVAIIAVVLWIAYLYAGAKNDSRSTAGAGNVITNRIVCVKA
jgi:hypothetical protein